MSTELRIGQTLYHVRVTLNALSRKKIRKVDNDGVTWYRYDKEIRDYNIEEWEVTGKITFLVEGELNSYSTYVDEESRVEYALASSEGDEAITNDFFNDDEFYLTREEAEARIAELQSRDREIDNG